MLTSSPSSRNPRDEPSPRVTALRPAHVTSRSEPQVVCSGPLADFCRLDILINNAGIFRFGEVADPASRASAGPSAGEGDKR